MKEENKSNVWNSCYDPLEQYFDSKREKIINQHPDWYQ